MGKCRISSWASLIRDLPDTTLLKRKKKKKERNAVLAHRFTENWPRNRNLHLICMWSSQLEEENVLSKQGGLLFDMCIMYSHASRSGQASCISCSTWMNSAAEHAQVMLSKGQFELSQTGVEPLIGMLSRFHFSRALF